MSSQKQVARLAELEANTDRTPEEEAVRVALIALRDAEAVSPFDRVAVDAAREAVNEAEEAVVESEE